MARNCHLKRIYGKNHEDDSTNTDIWIEVLRSDRFEDMQNAGGQRQFVRLKWKDGDGEADSQRTTERVRFDNPEDPTTYFEVDVIKKVIAMNSDQRIIYTFKNSLDGNTARRADVVRVYSMEQAVLPARGTLAEYIAALETAREDEDTSQYLTVEVARQYRTKQQRGFDYKASTDTLKNAGLSAVFDASTDAALVRLDPFQVIVNCQLNPVTAILVTVSWVVTPHHATAAAGTESTHIDHYPGEADAPWPYWSVVNPGLSPNELKDEYATSITFSNGGVVVIEDSGSAYKGPLGGFIELDDIVPVSVAGTRPSFSTETFGAWDFGRAPGDTVGFTASTAGAAVTYTFKLPGLVGGPDTYLDNRITGGLNIISATPDGVGGYDVVWGPTTLAGIYPPTSNATASTQTLDFSGVSTLIYHGKTFLAYEYNARSILYVREDLLP